MRHWGASWLLPLLRHNTQHHTPSPSPLLTPPAFQGIFGTAQHLLSWQQNERRGRVGLPRRSTAICLFPGLRLGVAPQRKTWQAGVYRHSGSFHSRQNWPLCGFNHWRAAGTIRECHSGSAASNQRGEPDAQMPLFFISLANKKKDKKSNKMQGEG